MTDLELMLQRAFDAAAADIPIPEDPWPHQRELIGQRRYQPRRERTWLWVGLTVAAACLLLLTVLLIVPAVTGNGDTPPAQPSPIPAPTGPPSLEQQFTRTYLNKCLSDPSIASFAAGDPRVSPAGAIVRLVGRDQWGETGVITTPRAIGVCEIDRRGQWHSDGFAPMYQGTPRQIQSPITGEISIPARPHGVPTTEGSEYFVTVGRVASNIARVDWVVGGHSVAQATVGNGVYVIRIAKALGAGGQLVAYDVSGHVVYDNNSRCCTQPIPWP